MSLAKKLNLKDGTRLRVIGRPEGVDLDDVTTTASATTEGVLAFARTLADVDVRCGPVLDATQASRLAWVAYPKAGQFGTDLNRDILWKRLLGRGVRAVRQVAIDDVWKVLRRRSDG